MLIILAIVVIMLARDPYVTLAVTTITGIVLAISIQSVIGNAIAGMVLAIVRSFKIGDTIKPYLGLQLCQGYWAAVCEVEHNSG